MDRNSKLVKMQQRIEASGSLGNESAEDGDDFESSPDGKVIGDEFMMDGDDNDFDDDDMIDDDMVEDEQEPNTLSDMQKIVKKTKSIEETNSKKRQQSPEIT